MEPQLGIRLHTYEHVVEYTSIPPLIPEHGLRNRYALIPALPHICIISTGDGCEENYNGNAFTLQFFCYAGLNAFGPHIAYGQDWLTLYGKDIVPAQGIRSEE